MTRLPETKQKKEPSLIQIKRSTLFIMIITFVVTSLLWFLSPRFSFTGLIDMINVVLTAIGVSTTVFSWLFSFPLKSDVPLITDPDASSSKRPGEEISAYRVGYGGTLRLGDQNYVLFPVDAEEDEKQPEDFLQERAKLHVQLPSLLEQALTTHDVAKHQYSEGKLLSLAKQQSLSQEKSDERERLAQIFAVGKSASEMVIEDRGPY